MSAVRCAKRWKRSLIRQAQTQATTNRSSLKKSLKLRGIEPKSGIGPQEVCPFLTLRTLIIAPDPEMASYLQRTLSAYDNLSIAGVLDGYPAPSELPAILHRSQAQALFAEVDQPGAVPRLISHMEEAPWPLHTIAVGRRRHPEHVMSLMETGIDEFLAVPFEPACLHACLGRLLQ